MSSTKSPNSAGSADLIEIGNSTRSREPLSQRQSSVLHKLFDGFEGKVTSSKWARLTKCLQDTAHRDIINLVDRGILKQDAAAVVTHCSMINPGEYSRLCVSVLAESSHSLNP